MHDAEFDEDEVVEKEADGTQAQSMQSLGSRLAGTFQEYKDARKETENEWLSNTKNVSGAHADKYSPHKFRVYPEKEDLFF